eukprot:symbB.v1.2.011167.t1/scaffold705.1/size174302/14
MVTLSKIVMVYGHFILYGLCRRWRRRVCQFGQSLCRMSRRQRKSGNPAYTRLRRREISSETILAQLLRLGTSFSTAFRKPLVIAQAAEMSKVKIIIWDHNRDGMLERAAVAYADESAAKYIWGLGYHWYGDGRFETWPESYEIEFEDRKNEDEAIHELKARPIGIEAFSLQSICPVEFF